MSSSWRNLLGGGAAATCILAADPTSAVACHDDPDLPGYRKDASLGFTVGIAFGGRTRLFYGIDLRLTSGQRAAIARAEIQGISSLRLVGAGQYVTDADASLEAGLAFHTGQHGDPEDAAVGLHLAGGKYDDGGGLQVQSTIPFWGNLGNWDLGAGVVLVPGEVQLFCGGGRRLRGEGDATVLPAVARLAGDRPGDEPAARAWIRDAQAEHASIRAFERMAAELRAAGAPDDLVTAARAAAEDESRHTEMCRALAGVPFWLLPLGDEHARRRWARPGRDALVSLAREAWLDGCVGEGIAAAQAAAAAGVARDEAAAVQALIAADERRHAELAWAILEWAWREGDGAARDRIAGWVEAGAPAAAAEPPDGDEEEMARRGRLPARLATAAAEREIDQATRRVRRLIG